MELQTLFKKIMKNNTKKTKDTAVSCYTSFMDMHSGGGTKEPPYEYIYINAPEDEAELIFYNRFGHSPSRVTCTCCGDDYSVDENKDLEQATGFQRNCLFAYFRPDGTECPESEGFISGKGQPKGYTSRYVERHNSRHGDYIPLSKYLERNDVLVIENADIKDNERQGEVPQEGYIWM